MFDIKKGEFEGAEPPQEMQGGAGGRSPPGRGSGGAQPPQDSLFIKGELEGRSPSKMQGGLGDLSPPRIL